MSKITIEAEISASRDKVWEYYNFPEHITKWNFAAETWHCPHAESDLQPGGKYLARMEAKDGSFGFDFEAIFNEVIAPEKLSYTMLDGRTCEIVFKKSEDKTRVTVSFDPENMNPEDIQRDGWQAILNNFKKYAENQ